jgi:glucose-6-phosphate isomerase
MKAEEAKPRSMTPLSAEVFVDWPAGRMLGSKVMTSEKRLGDLKGIFRDEAVRCACDAATVVYRVQYWQPVEAGREGGLFWGVTRVEPGAVGDEFYMTHGHFHANRTRGEYYATVQGEGLLMLMDDERRTWTEAMSAGSLHCIDGRYAHRVINTGETPLIFWACWPSDAGYDYGAILRKGFGARVFRRGRERVVVPEGER